MGYTFLLKPSQMRVSLALRNRWVDDFCTLSHPYATDLLNYKKNTGVIPALRLFTKQEQQE